MHFHFIKTIPDLKNIENLDKLNVKEDEQYCLWVSSNKYISVDSFKIDLNNIYPIPK